MDNNKESDNKGCLVFTIIGVIISLIYTFSTTSADDFAEMGQTILFLVGCVVAYFIVKNLKLFQSSSDDKQQRSDSYNNSSDLDNGYKRKNEDNSKGGDLKGCLWIVAVLIIIIAIFAIVVTLFTSSFEMNEGVGIAFIVIAIIVAAIYFYSSTKDS